MIVYLIIAFIVFVLDQITKWLVKTNMELGETIPVIGNFFILTSHRNKGAAFGILQGQQVFFLLITVVFLIGLIWYLYKTYKSGQKWVPFALSLIFGGAVGNFIDRAIYGEVVDFVQWTFDFSYIGIDYVYVYPIFNVADSGIVVGTIMILIHTLLEWRRDSNREAAAKESTNDTV